jgi:hypothetical protein
MQQKEWRGELELERFSSPTISLLSCLLQLHHFCRITKYTTAIESLRVHREWIQIRQCVFSLSK